VERFFDAPVEDFVERDALADFLPEDFFFPPELRRAADFLPPFLPASERLTLVTARLMADFFFDDFLPLLLREDDFFEDFDDFFEDFLLEEPLREPPLPDDFFEEPFFDAAMGMSPFKSVG
jgi:hypothetical protein